MLEEALLNYAGSVVLISHDRYFMSQVANTIFSFHDRTVERFDCDYHDYLEREAAALEELQAAEQAAEDAALEARAAAEDEDAALKHQFMEQRVIDASADVTSYRPPPSALLQTLTPRKGSQGFREDNKFNDDVEGQFVSLSSSMSPDDLTWVGDVSTPSLAPRGVATAPTPGSASADQESNLPPLPKLPLNLADISLPRGAKDAKVSVTVTSSRQDARGKVSLKEKVVARYVAGDKYKITHAKEVLVDVGEEARKNKRKNFGGSGVTCGNLNKGIKNAKRFKNNI